MFNESNTVEAFVRDQLCSAVTQFRGVGLLGPHVTTARSAASVGTILLLRARA
jgi:hypothetical protein